MISIRSLFPRAAVLTCTLTCALSGTAQSQRLIAWTDSSYPTVAVPFAVTDVAVGDRHALALRADGTLYSWGSDAWGAVGLTPAGTYIAVAAGEKFSAAIRTDGTIVAWGDDSWGEVSGTPSGTFTAIAAGWSHGLAIRTDGTLVTWGRPDNGLVNVPSGTFTAIAGGQYHSLALRSDGELFAWGWNGYGNVSNKPSGSFIDVASGSNHSLAIRDDGSLVAWGQYVNEFYYLPPGNFRKVASGGLDDMALDVDGNLFAMNGESSFYAPTTGRFLKIATGGRISAAIESVCVPVSLDLQVTSLVGGNQTTATVTLSEPAPTNTVVVISSNSALTSQAKRVVIPAGGTQATFAVNTTATATKGVATLTVKTNLVKATARLAIFPPQIYGISAPAWVTGPATFSATLTISDPAPVGGLTVTLASSNTLAATVPATVTILAGQTSVTFDVTCSDVAKAQSTTLKATRTGCGSALAYLRVY